MLCVYPPVSIVIGLRRLRWRWREYEGGKEGGKEGRR